MSAMTTLNKPAQIVYTFLPIPQADDREVASWQYLRAQWHACVSLGMIEPLKGGMVPTAFPASPPEPGPFRLLSFGRHPAPDMVSAAFLFVEHDVVGLVTAMAPNGDSCRVGWTALSQRWTDAVGRQPPADLLGEVVRH